MRVDPNNINQLVQQLGSLTASETQVTQQISTGSRLTNLSDDAVAAAQSVSLSSSIAATDTFVQTASGVQSRMQAADTALGSVVTSLNSAIALAVQGTSATASAANLQTIAQQLSSLRDTILSLANSSYQGTYLFSGTQGTTAPFSLDSSGNATYAGDNQTGTLSIMGSGTVATGVTGAQAFGTGTGNDVFAALNQLINDFSSGTASASAANDLATLRSAFDNVTQQRAGLDSSIARISTASTMAQTQKTNLQAAQTTLVSADTATLAAQLSSVEAQRSALLSTIATVEKRGTLFDYLS